MDLSRCANPEVHAHSKTKRGISRHPASVLASESALGLLPSIALSSAQVGPHSNLEPKVAVILKLHLFVSDRDVRHGAAA
jgi:hypothetical protein